MSARPFGGDSPASWSQEQLLVNLHQELRERGSYRTADELRRVFEGCRLCGRLQYTEPRSKLKRWAGDEGLVVCDGCFRFLERGFTPAGRVYAPFVYFAWREDLGLFKIGESVNQARGRKFGDVLLESRNLDERGVHSQLSHARLEKTDPRLSGTPQSGRTEYFEDCTEVYGIISAGLGFDSSKPHLWPVLKSYLLRWERVEVAA